MDTDTQPQPESPAQHPASNEPPAQGNPAPPPQNTTPPNEPLNITEKKPRKKLVFLIIALVLIVAAIGAVVFLLNKPGAESNNTADTGRQTQQATEESLVASVKSLDDLNELTEEQMEQFCTELLTHNPEGPEVTALHERLGLDGGLYENLYLGCQVHFDGRDYVRKDKSGENDAYYRRDAQKYKDIARSVSFDLYDTTYTADNLSLSKRVMVDNEGEAKFLFMEYTTLDNGGFNPYASKPVVRIEIFDVRDFPRYTNLCGPGSLVIENTNDYIGACTKTDATFQGQPVYKGASSYYVTVDNTRIGVLARDEPEVLAVIAGLKKATLDELDFFIKN